MFLSSLLWVPFNSPLILSQCPWTILFYLKFWWLSRFLSWSTTNPTGPRSADSSLHSWPIGIFFLFFFLSLFFSPLWMETYLFYFCIEFLRVGTCTTSIEWTKSTIMEPMGVRSFWIKFGSNGRRIMRSISDHLFKLHSESSFCGELINRVFI